ncbi:hypothetical protein Tco_0882326, partial [Tanacetum coccineum]
MGEVDIETFTMEQYLALDHGDIRRGVRRPEIERNVDFESEKTQRRKIDRRKITESFRKEPVNTPRSTLLVLQNELPPKEKDPRSFILPCIIVNTTVSNALADLGVPIILGRPMLATAYAKIDVFGKKICLEVGMEKVVFNANEGRTLLSVGTDLDSLKYPNFDDEMGIRLEDLGEGIEIFWEA